MLTTALLLAGAVLLAIVLAEVAVRKLPLTPAVIYLGVGWLAGALFGAPDAATFERHAGPLTLLIEAALLVSLFAVGLRLRFVPTFAAWRGALLLAGPGLVVAVALGTVAGMGLLGLPMGAALLLAAILAPTDPVLASEVQIRSETDRDAVRLSLTAEGGLNDGSALPAVMLGLGLIGVHRLEGDGGPGWWWSDLLWPIGGGALIGLALGLGIGWLLRWRLRQGDPVARDELLYAAGVALAWGAARASGTSTFIVAFVAAVSMLLPLREAAAAAAHEPRPRPDAGGDLAERLHAFGASVERLVEAVAVMAVGVALNSIVPDPMLLVFAAVLVLLVRPLSVLAVLWGGQMSPAQRRLAAWFGIRGVGTLFYLAFAIEHGLSGAVAELFIAASLVAIAASIVLHGVSATPLMNAYQRRWRKRAAEGAEPVRDDE